MNTLLRLTKTAIGLVYPAHCAACGKPLPADSETAACGRCLSAIKPNPRPYCAVCGHGLRDASAACPGCRAFKPSFTLARSACLYEGALKEMVHRYKYGNLRSLAALFTDLLMDFLRRDGAPLEGADIVTFVPLRRKRLSERGFNQSELLARGIAARAGLAAAACLEKSGRTRNQNELPRDERLANLRGAFRPRAGARAGLAGKTALLVDDVMTTGATLDECSRALLAAGAREVRCITLARGI